MTSKAMCTTTLSVLVFVISILSCICAPTIERSFYDAMQESSKVESYKCPALRKSMYFTPEPEFLKDCTNLDKANSLTKFTMLNLREALCLLYFASFHQLCFQSKNINEVNFVEKINNSTFSDEKMKFEEVCGELNNLTPMQDNTVGFQNMMKLFKDKKKCRRFCLDEEENIQPICMHSAYMVRVAKQFEKAPLPVPPQVNKIEVKNPVTTTEQPVISNAEDVKPADVKPADVKQTIVVNNKADSNANIEEPIVIKNDNDGANENIKSKTYPESNSNTENEKKPKIEQHIVSDIHPVQIKDKLMDNPQIEEKEKPSEKNLDEVITPKTNPPPIENSINDQNQSEDMEFQNGIIEKGKSLAEEYTDEDDLNEQFTDKYTQKSFTHKKPPTLGEDLDGFSRYNTDDIDGESSFIPYFMIISAISILGIVAYFNKQKILAMVLEGRKVKRSPRGRRPNSANYHKLDSNLEEAVTSSCNKNTTQIIY